MTKQINLKKDDLPDGYRSHFSEMKQIDSSWHFDPNKNDNSAKKLSPINISSELQNYLKKYCLDIPIEIGTSVRDTDINNYKENTLISNKFDHVFHGYTQHNSQMQYKRISKNEAHPILNNVIEQTGLKNSSIGLIKVAPGQVIPWHYDSYVFYKEQNSNSEINNVERHIIFPFNWHWGHIYQIGNNVISNWGKGVRYTWPKFRYHLAVNAGIKSFYLLAVTGSRL
tara:strand:+ start:864 stop:1541 length:678 start_codon:yes stop_codon:yes gene_type:complete